MDMWRLTQVSQNEVKSVALFAMNDWTHEWRSFAAV
jgi:hypothetical protein